MPKTSTKLRIEALKAYLIEHNLPRPRPAGRPNEVYNPNIPPHYLKF